MTAPDSDPGVRVSDTQRGGRLLAGSATTAGAAAALAAAIAGLCCVGPVTVMLLGAGGAVAAAGLKPFRLPLLMVSGVLLGAGYWRTYWWRGALEGQACPVRIGRFVRVGFCCAVVLWIVAATLFLLE